MATESSGSSSSSLAIRNYSDGPPWIFQGRALYQLHAVKSSVARKFVPPELKLVEAFGYTLGGIFLAHYEGSPAGEFDEAVVIAGIVWNPPTSCAWAGSVLVGSEEARMHGRKEVGLPSHLGHFSYKVTTVPSNSCRPLWDPRGWFTARQKLRMQQSVQIEQRDPGRNTPLCTIVGIPDILPVENDHEGWRGPSVQLHLPNFSGKTREQPNLLKYSCALSCAVKMVSSARVIHMGEENCDSEETRAVVDILTGKPLASIFFDRMMMRVEAPTLLNLKDADKKKTLAGEPSPELPATTPSVATS